MRRAFPEQRAPVPGPGRRGSAVYETQPNDNQFWRNIS